MQNYTGAHSDEIKRAETPLSPENIQVLFTQVLRDDMQHYVASLQITGEVDFYTEALKFASITYDTLVIGLSKSQNDRIKFPPADAIHSTEDVERFYVILKEEKSILSEDLENHVKGWKSTNPAPERAKYSSEKEYDDAVKVYDLQLKEYIEGQHLRTRNRIAGTWAEGARTLFLLRTAMNAVTSTALSAQIEAKQARKEGRDLVGRIGYYLMNISPSDIAKDLGGLDTMEGANKQRGMAYLALNVASAFSDAACHNDARQMCDALSKGLVSSGKQPVGDHAKTSALILSQIRSCPGQRVLKLTNFANHSTVYLISGEQCTRYESIAGQNSKTIMYNDIISTPPTSAGLEQKIQADVAGIAKESSDILEWEVHEATSLEEFQKRIYARLRNGTTQLSLGLAFAAFEKIKEISNFSLGNVYKLDLARYSQIPLPLQLINDASNTIKLCNFSNAALPDLSTLVRGESYRLCAQTHWTKVLCLGVATGLPTWMSPCGAFQIQEISDQYTLPQLRALRDGEQSTTMSQFLFQVVGMKSQFSGILKPTQADYPKEHGNYVIVEDPFWETGGGGRRIIYRKK